MLNGEVRFGKDWADQVTQISSWRNYCHGHIVRARAYVWACVCVALCACLSKRASVCLYLFLNQYTLLPIHTTSHIHTLYQLRTQTLFFFFEKSAHQYY